MGNRHVVQKDPVSIEYIRRQKHSIAPGAALDS